MDTEFTTAELDYIRSMFGEVEPRIDTVLKASQLGGMVGLFVDNRDIALAEGEDWPLDISITEKVFAYHNIPLATNYATFDAKYAKAVAKTGLTAD